MPSLPVLSGEACVAVLLRLGYVQVGQKGSHVRLHCPGRAPVTVPLHRELKRGTLRSILRAANLSVEELLERCG
ncbi:MAG: type II toxin-antitoxin system HicA family toxin [Nannocystaceae bacterium]